jgi:uncharacterized protein
MAPTLSQIAIYPIKSLDGTLVSQARITAGGALEFDRRWALVDSRDRFVNAKRYAQIQQLRADFDLESRSVRLWWSEDGTGAEFDLEGDLNPLERWLSNFFDFPVRVIEDRDRGFPDDLKAYGPTLISTATLQLVCEWFPELDLAEARRRFRTNLEIDGVPALWEDRLFSDRGVAVPFQVGSVNFLGINPCARCVVPTRSSLTGVANPQFAANFDRYRQANLPAWANINAFNHFYRLALNTQIPLDSAGKSLALGDEVRER